MKRHHKKDANIYWISEQKRKNFCPVCNEEKIFLNDFEDPIRERIFYICSGCKCRAVISYDNQFLFYRIPSKIFIEKFGKKEKETILINDIEHIIKPMLGGAWH